MANTIVLVLGDEKYEPTVQSVTGHPLPQWYDDAKFGIMVSWTVSSVPAWASVENSSAELWAKDPTWKEFCRLNPYAEWYWNTIKIEGSPAREHHLSTYGADYPFSKFLEEFNERSKDWRPAEWADLFARSGAKYVVPVTKHHDGVLLWHSSVKNPHHPDYISERDIIGELAGAVEDKGMRFGLYYSGGYDWSFNDPTITNITTAALAVPMTPEYSGYVLSQYKELIDRFKPAVLWNDIIYPSRTDLPVLLAYYYNAVPDGVVNDRLELPGADNVIQGDFSTPEYFTFNEVKSRKWEAVRSCGLSFGYNQLDTEDHYLSADTLIDMMVDIVSKNGNFLLNVGPRSDGTIPEGQKQRLLSIGKWLAVNGDAIYGTRPWLIAESNTTDGGRVRFTTKGDALYIILLDDPEGSRISVKNLTLKEGSKVTMLGYGSDALEISQRDGTLAIQLPYPLNASEAYAFKAVPVP